MVVDNLWSLQYMVPGPLTAGAFITHETDQRWGSQEPRHRTQHRAHALHFRFNKDAAFHAFFNHPLTIKAFESAAHDQAIELGTLCCRVSVANELETLFRRGAEWEKGLELVVALEESSVQVGEPLDECLFLMERLATSSAFGAVHAASGDIQNTDSLPFMSKSKPTKVFIARFGTESQLTAFLNSPPVEALLRPGGGLPAPWMSVLESAPAENTKNLEGLRRMF